MNPVEVELDLMFWALDVHSFVLCFSEVNGDCRFNIRVDPGRAVLLKLIVTNEKPNDTMYEVLEKTIKMGGQHPTHITIDRRCDRYSATVHLGEDNSDIEIPLASDGILFALSARLPIYATPSAMNANCID